MRGDEIRVGDVIDYRGIPAVVTAAWSSQDVSPIRKAPVGCEILWTDENGNEQRTRIVWPDLTADERRRPEAGGLDTTEVAERLIKDLGHITVEPADEG